MASETLEMGQGDGQAEFRLGLPIRQGFPILATHHLFVQCKKGAGHLGGS